MKVLQLAPSSEKNTSAETTLQNDKNDQTDEKPKKKLQQRNPINILKGVSSEVNNTRKQKIPNNKANAQFCSEKKI